MIRPNKINPVEAAAEKYNFFLLSFFLFTAILFRRTFMLLLFDWVDGGSFSRYLAISFSLTLIPEFFITLFNHVKLIFANLLERKINSKGSHANYQQR